MSGPHVVRPTVLVPCEAWQVEPGNANLEAACRWVDGEGIWGEDAPHQTVWLRGGTPARAGKWIVKTPAGPLVLSAEEFAAAWEIVIDTWTAMARHACQVLAPQFAEAARQAGDAFAAIGKALQRHDLPGPPGHATPDDDRWAMLIERKRAGVGAGPGAPRMDGRRSR